MFVTFLTDFGLQDDFVGTCHGVIKRIAPDVQVIDITHGIPPRAIVQGALVLANTVPYMPVGVHLAVVDPGVGGPRRALALRDAEGRAYVGPDNGLLLPAAERAGIAEAHEIVNPEYALSPVSRTFHGRDIFAPAAAHVAKGLAPAELGPPIDPSALVRLELPQPEVRTNRIGASILYVDAFGNIQLNLTRGHLDQADVQPGARIELELAGQRYYAIAARTFSDARTGDLILYEDSYGNVAVAMNRGNAAEMLAARAGQELRVHLDVP
jgi:S-adenosyl-L-methionine hydrolase (adenosine-forming)